MKKRLWIDMIAIILICGGFIGVWYFFGWGKEIIIQEQTPLKQTMTQKPQNQNEYIKAFQAPWQMEGWTEGPWFHVHAWNGYHDLKKSWKLTAKMEEYHHDLSALIAYGLSYNSVLRKLEHGYGGGLQYHYWIDHFGLGPGIMVMKFPSSIDVIAIGAISYRW